MEHGLSNKTIEKINSVLLRFEKIEKVFLFCSRAVGNYKPGSDIDLVLFGKNIGLKEHNLLANLLDDLMLPNKIDLIFDNIKNDELINHILRAGKIFYTKQIDSFKN